MNRERITENVRLLFARDQDALWRRFGFFARCGAKAAFAKRLLQSSALDAVLKPELYRLIKQPFRFSGRCSLRDYVELGAYGNPSIAPFATDESPELNLQLDRFYHRVFSLAVR